jgi:lysine biosynthesis protein LysW
MTAVTKVEVKCLDCGRMIKLSFEPVVGRIITCPNCEAEFEVIAVSPVELDWAFFDPEDKDDDRDDDDNEDWD